jgi:uncharacterized protein YjiK
MISLPSLLRKYCLNRFPAICRLSIFLIASISVSFCNSSTGKKHSQEQDHFSSSEVDSLLNSASDINKHKVIKPMHSGGSFSYDLHNPDERYLLPKYLREISGLAYYEENKILCIQDEKANIYVLNLDKKEIVNKYDFGTDGDYEDIAVIGKTAFALRSDGQIFAIENFEKENRKVLEYKTRLSGKNNTEGMAYDKYTNSLLIACKGSPAVEKDKPYDGYKAIYKFDLGDMKLVREPEFLFDLNRPGSFKDSVIFNEYSLRIKKTLQLRKGHTSFHPSGLAIHPVNNEIYLISSIGKMLIILDRHGKVAGFHNLSNKIFIQPEGICFSPSGDLFISSEGQGGNGYILKFNPGTDK